MKCVRKRDGVAGVDAAAHTHTKYAPRRRRLACKALRSVCPATAVANCWRVTWIKSFQFTPLVPSLNRTDYFCKLRAKIEGKLSFTRDCFVFVVSRKSMGWYLKNKELFFLVTIIKQLKYYESYIFKFNIVLSIFLSLVNTFYAFFLSWERLGKLISKMSYRYLLNALNKNILLLNYPQFLFKKWKISKISLN